MQLTKSKDTAGIEGRETLLCGNLLYRGVNERYNDQVKRMNVEWNVTNR